MSSFQNHTAINRYNDEPLPPSGTEIVLAAHHRWHAPFPCARTPDCDSEHDRMQAMERAFRRYVARESLAFEASFSFKSVPVFIHSHLMVGSDKYPVCSFVAEVRNTFGESVALGRPAPFTFERDFVATRVVEKSGGGFVYEALFSPGAFSAEICLITELLFNNAPLQQVLDASILMQYTMKALANEPGLCAITASEIFAVGLGDRCSPLCLTASTARGDFFFEPRLDQVTCRPTVAVVPITEGTWQVPDDSHLYESQFDPEE